MNKGLIAVVVVIILAVGGWLAFGNKSNDNSSNTTSTSSNASQQSNTTPNNQQQTSASGKVSIQNMQFTPSQVTITKGGSVTWTNNDSTTHTVTDDLSNVGGPNSGNIAPGESYSFTFDKTGSFQYHCSIHPSMRGTIVVK
jgi:plastocyanin